MEAQNRSGVPSGTGVADERTGSIAESVYWIADDTTEYLDKLARGQIYRYSLGIGDTVDKETAGAEAENLVIIAGETKGGKTLAAVNVVHDNLRFGVRVLVVTTEVSAVSYLLRLVSRITHIPLSVMRDGLSDVDHKRVTGVLGKLKRSSLYIADRPLCDIEEIYDAITETNPEIVVIDHLQRIQFRGDNPAIGYKNIALKLKNIAVTRRMPVVLLSQVTFGEGWCETAADGSLRYHTERMHTRWSKEPVMEADKVLVLHNIGLHDRDKRGEANLIVHSMRDYSSGEVIPLKIKPEHQFLGDYERFGKEYGHGAA